MNVLVTGGTGFVGQVLVSMLCARGDRVVIVTRNPERARAAQAGVTFERWLPDVARFDAVVHLAGEPIVGKRWSDAQKRVLTSSRVDSTQLIVAAFERSSKRPRVFVSASAVGWYGDRGEDALTESAAPADNFLGRLCVQWEQAADPAEQLGVRVVHPRIGIVLGLGGGVLSKAVPVFKFGVGGSLGPKQSWFPWVHVDDLARFIVFAIDNESVRGSFNVVAPGIVRQGDFAQALGAALGRPALFPVPKFALKLVLGEVANALTASQRCVPERTLAAGFEFEHPDLQAALKHALQKA
ncbi:MAG: TIGR01777 family oxidoreductase [Planctomycetes bacterium]|nr:TIGR01777 family oxidoreductase [Planctomycetota bacterium]